MIMIMIMIMKRLNNIFYFSFGNCKHCRHIFVSCYPIGSTTTPDQTNYSIANPATSMEFLRKKAEELKEKGVGRLQGTHQFLEPSLNIQ